MASAMKDFQSELKAGKEVAFVIRKYGAKIISRGGMGSLIVVLWTKAGNT